MSNKNRKRKAHDKDTNRRKLIEEINLLPWSFSFFALKTAVQLIF